MNLKRLALALFFCAFAIRIVLAVIFPLIPDEAYYWSWSTKPAISYWDQPAGSAFFLGLAERWFGHSELSLRLLPILGSMISALLIFLIVREFLSFELALLCVTIPLYTPIAFGQTLALHDSFMVPFWTMALAAANKLRKEPKKILWWLLLAGFWALAVYSKLNALFFGFGILIFCVATKRYRDWLLNVRAWIAALLFLLLIAPIFIWNIEHQGITFLAVKRLTLIHPTSTIASVVTSILEFFGSQALLITPGFFVLILISLWRAPFDFKRERDDLPLFFFSFSAPVFLYFLWVAFKSKVQGNWPAPMYVAAVPLVIWYAKKLWSNRFLRIFIKISIVACALEIIALGAHLAFPVAKIPQDPTLQMWGWKELAARVEEEAKICDASFLLTRKYQVGSELMFYLKNQLPVLCANYSGRGNQFDLWNDFAAVANKNAIIVDTRAVSLKLLAHFDSHEMLNVEVAHRANLSANIFYIYCAKNFKIQGPHQDYFRAPFEYGLKRLKTLVRATPNESGN